VTKLDKIIKRVFDFCLALIGLILTGWILIIAIIIARYDTKLSGLFFQTRVGQYGKLFKVFKLRSMKDVAGVTTTVSTDFDPRITKIGKIWRKTKIDELPQLFNVLIGQMSFVGPRPDVPGFADELKEEDAIILTVKPGITGPASIFFKNEEEILSKQANPEEYNRNVIWPQKVELNKSYIKNFSVIKDIKYILKTIF
jgi:lipopolysaccharide/colanic/teichoic acid biosynthesis glycosyltransferase